MRTAERDALLFILAVSAGAADGWSYLGLGHAFVANMTGNTVLLGIAVFQRQGDLLHPFIALTTYAVGAAWGSFMTRKVKPHAVWAREISLTLLLEGLLIAAAQCGWALWRGGTLAFLSADTAQNSLLALVALAVGLQSGAILQLKIPGIVTTYITGTWTNLVNGIVQFFSKRPAEKDSEQRFEQRLWMQAGILLCYFTSAVLTGWLHRYLPSAIGILPAVCVLAVAGYGGALSQSGD